MVCEEWEDEAVYVGHLNISKIVLACYSSFTTSLLASVLAIIQNMLMMEALIYS